MNILSSVTNTYGASAGTTEQVAAKLFKMVDRGRVVTGDLANTFGRVLFTSQELGVNFNEVTASIAMMTRAGVTADDSITLLNNLMLHTAKPSEQMKKYFNELGISVPRDAFKMLGGIKGVVDVMNKGIKAGKLNPEDLFPEARTNRAFNFFAGRTDDLKKEMQIIGEESGDTYAKAVILRAEPMADKLAKIFAGVKNGLTTSIGTAFNRQLVGGIESLSGMNVDEMTSSNEKLAEAVQKVEDAIGRVARITATAVISFGAAKVATTGWLIVSELLYAQQLKNSAISKIMDADNLRGVVTTRAAAAAQLELARASAGAGASKLGAGAAVARANPLAAALTIGATVLVGYEAYKQTALDTFSSSKEALIDYVNNFKKLELGEPAKKAISFLDALRAKMDELDAKKGKGLMAGLAESNARMDVLRNTGTRLSDSLKSGFAGYVGLLNKNFSDTESKLSKLRETIDGMAKAKSDFGISIQDTLFNLQKDYATPFQKGDLLRQNIGAMTQQAEEAYGKGTPEGVAEGRALYQRIVQEKAELAKLDMDFRKAQMEANGGGVVLYDPLPLARDLAATAARKAELEAKVTKEMEQQIKIGREQQAIAKTKIKDAEANFKAFEDFSIYEQGSNDKIKSQYQNKTGGLDIEKVRADFERIKKNLRGSLEGGSTADRLGLSGLINLREDNIFGQISEIQTAKGLAEQQNKLNEMSKGRNATLTEQQTVLQNVTTKQDGLNTSLKTHGDELERNAKLIEKVYSDARISKFGGKIAEFAEGHVWTPEDADGKKRNDYLAEQAKAAKELIAKPVPKIKLADGVEVPDPEAYKAKIEGFAAIAEDIRQKRILMQQDLDNRPGDDIGDKQKNAIKDLQDSETRIRVGIEAMKKELKALYSAVDQADWNQKVLQQMEDRLKKEAEVATASTTAKDTINANLKAIGDEAVAQSARVDALRDAIRNLAKEGKLPGVQQDAGDDSETYAYGGPIGKDTVSAWLQRGEHVMTAAASNRFYSQITAMNNTARRPQYFNNGGSVGGGDVTINVNESQRPMQTGREIARILKRTQRNG